MIYLVILLVSVLITAAIAGYFLGFPAQLLKKIRRTWFRTATHRSTYPAPSNDTSPSLELQYNKLPADTRQRWGIVYDQYYPSHNIYCFKDNNEKWGVIVFDAAKQQFTIIVAASYHSTAFNTAKAIITAVRYTNDKYSTDGNAFFLFDTEGKPVASLDNTGNLQFDAFGNNIVSKNRLSAVLNDEFELQFDYQYHILLSLGNNLFKAVQKNETGTRVVFNGIIDSTNTVIASFDTGAAIFNHLYKDELIVQEQQQYFAFNVLTRQKRLLHFDTILNCEFGNFYNPVPKYKTIVHTVDRSIDNDKLDLGDMVKYKGQWGLIYPNGEILIPNQYDYIAEMPGHFFKVAVGEFNFTYAAEHFEMTATGIHWGLVDLNNTVLIPVAYDWLYNGYPNINDWFVNTGGVLKYSESEHDGAWRVEGGKNKRIALQTEL